MNQLKCEYGFQADVTSRTSFRPCSKPKGHEGSHQDGYGFEHHGERRLWSHRYELAKDNEIADLRNQLETQAQAKVEYSLQDHSGFPI